MALGRHSFFCIDAHTCGNPVRVVVGGAPPLVGPTMAERRRHFVAHHDWVRRALMFEPRGHDVMSGAIPCPPCDPAADLGILFIEVSGCLPMCGHGAIGTVTAALEHGLVTPRTPGRLLLDTPAGPVEARYSEAGGRVEVVALTNVASFVAQERLEIAIEGLGGLEVDIAYGGNFYAIIEPQRHFAGLEAIRPDDILRWSPLVRDAVNRAVATAHPLQPWITGVSHVMWTGAPGDGAHGRNAVFYGSRAIDRSPCGTGTSARMAQLHARGRLEVGAPFIHESIIGTRFTGRIRSLTEVAGRAAIVPSIEGWARVTGLNTIIVDETDPLKHGFALN